ncbi:MAG TPA: ATP-dependent DNA ligase [Planctomycetota bacterium]|nr:ATP-dependent DNA ligase [Planctomycetota bacterium]
MSLPLKTTYAPMDAFAVGEIPDGPEWLYEPKWDGFRTLAFRDGRKLELQSKRALPLSRYFPELVEELRSLSAPKFVLDGEIVVPVSGKLSFDDLLMRIHPSESRINKLAQQTPAMLVVFDLLADEKGRSFSAEALSVRRPALEMFAKKFFKGHRRIILSPATTKREKALKWFGLVGEGLDGIIAKRTDLAYQSGLRTGMVKVKRLRSADCVVGGFRYLTGTKFVGSLLLGLYDGNGLLNHVGFTSTIRASDRPALTKKLEALIEAPGFTGSAPGGPSRWNGGKPHEFKPLRPELVVEVRYDHFSGGRFRHGTTLLRWRPDKAPRQCTMAQVEQESKIAELVKLPT